MVDSETERQYAAAITSGEILEGRPPLLQHPSIGQIQGKYNKGAVQYLGIQYATLANRFANPSVVEYTKNDTIDATRHGPPVVTPAGAAAMEMSFIQETLPELDVPPMSDTEGLNLNITVSVEGGAGLPVIVYIHGGGFAFGSSSYPHYDQSKIVELSVVMGQPIVAVNLNYRLGIPGFMTSKELRDAGITANRGLADQRAALVWIKKYIAGFGGDPEKVTVVGQSAGAASIHYQMLSEEPLFHQAILVGGSYLMMLPASVDKTEQLYQALVRNFGYEKLLPSERIQAWLEVPQEKLVAALTPELVSLGPAIDGQFIPSAPTFEGLQDTVLPGSKWCRRLFLLESQFDGSIFGQVNLNAREKGIGKAFIQSVENSLGQNDAAKLVSFYKIDENTADATALDAIIQFVTDIAFYAAAIRVAETWPGPSYVGHFNQPNPWEGPYKGRANHLLDIAFMWGNYNKKYGSENWAVARALAENVVSFVSEKDDLLVFNKDGKSHVTVFGENGTGCQVALLGHESTGRNHGILELGKAVGGLDKLLNAMVRFLQGV